MSDLQERIARLSPEELARLHQHLAQRGAARSAERRIPRREINGPSPLAILQERLWLLAQVESGNSGYNRPLALRLTGFLQQSALRQALRTLMDRHEILRTRFAIHEGKPAQVISPDSNLDYRMVDLSGWDSAQQEARARDLAAEEVLRPVDISTGPVFRATLLHFTAQDHVLLLIFHHIAYDGWSARVFLDEFARIYGALISGGSPALEELPIQYADFAEWQRQRVSAEMIDRQLDYWKPQLSGSIPLDLPTDRSRPGTETHRGGCVEILLPESQVDSLKGLGKQENCTLFMVLLAAFQVLLGRYTRSEDVVVASMSAGRNWVETEGMIGLFLNTYLLRTQLSGNPTFRELLGRARETCLGAYAHQDLPFAHLREILEPGRDLGVAPFFRVVINHENMPEIKTEIPGLKVEPFKFEIPVAAYDLTLEILPQGRELKIAFTYATDLFERGTIERMAGHFRTLVEAVIAGPDGRIATLPLLTPTERRQILVEWNRTEVEYPREATLHELFEAQAERRPEAVAISFEQQRLTYAELNRKANQLAYRLREKGVGLASRVGVCMERALEVVIGQLAILKAGGTCVPLDPAYPEKRLSFMMEDAGIQVLLAQERTRRRLPRRDLAVVCVDKLGDSSPAPSQHNPRRGAKPDDAAYVLYTSGSTGTPKGVEVLHRNIIRLVCGPDFIHFGPDEVFLQSSSISFDASTLEIWGALAHGGRCVLFPHLVPDLAQLRTVLARERVTTLWLTPSYFNTVVDSAPAILNPVRQLLVGGEALSVSHICRAISMLPNTQFVNGYGPTESGVLACCYRIPRTQSPAARSIPIGRPIANSQVYILDPWLQPVPIGVAGELYIGGDGLARGYLDRPEVTSQKFIPHPFSGQAGARLYKTGDLCRHLPDGRIEYLGRLDNMVKMRGFRIELGEIEAALAEHPEVAASAVAIREDVPGDKRLVAYAVPRQRAKPPTRRDLDKFLKEKLPAYMVPTDFLVLESLPLTPNGKLDYRALPASKLLPRAQNRYVAPRNQIEHQMVKIWEESLNVRPIGIEHDFFELGGHSLLAVRMMNRVEDTFGKSLPLATLFAEATIKHLVKCLGAASLREVQSPIVPVQPGGSRTPFFFLHGDVLGGLYCRKLARLIGDEQPFYSVMPNGIDGSPLLPSLAAMAEENIRRVLALQPQGPYLLGGYCNGGVVAYEMARQMTERGLEVGTVIMLDAVLPRQFGWLRRLVHNGAGLARLKLSTRRRIYSQLRNYLVRMGDAYHEGPLALLTLYWQTARRKLLGLLGTPPDELGIPPHAFDDPLQMARYDHLVRVLIDYQPGPFEGRIVLLRTQEGTEPDPVDRTAGWGELAPQIDVYDLPGDHLTCLTEHAGVVAGIIEKCLRGFHDADVGKGMALPGCSR